MFPAKIPKMTSVNSEWGSCQLSIFIQLMYAASRPNIPNDSLHQHLATSTLTVLVMHSFHKIIYSLFWWVNWNKKKTIVIFHIHNNNSIMNWLIVATTNLNKNQIEILSRTSALRSELLLVRGLMLFCLSWIIFHLIEHCSLLIEPWSRNTRLQQRWRNRQNEKSNETFSYKMYDIDGVCCSAYLSLY